MTSLADFTAQAADGSDTDLSAYAGKVVLVVNTATGCGYASQMPGLQQLHDEFADRGFAVLGFPSDQFKQEKVDDAEMAGVCQTQFGTTFPLFAKVKVNGKDSHPLFAWLKKQQKGSLGGRINWNFTKFLVDRDGRVVGRFSPTTEPEDLKAEVEAAVA
ncbi:MAG: glutathione peroxidase [Nocardioides sp.]